MKNLIKSSIIAMATVLLAMSNATATPISNTYSFYNISNNSIADVAVGISQLKMTVYGDTESPNQVYFEFNNIGPAASSITDIYFDDIAPPMLQTPRLFDSGQGVDFSQGASPKDLPGGKAFNFEVSANGSFDSNAPTQPMGINPGEWLKILFDVTSAYDITDIFSSLNDASLKVGIHVQGFEDGKSEAFINDPNPVPEPGTLVLFGAGILGVAIYSKRRRNS